ncbi:MAG: hypothetical protein MJ252_14145 [archaeon]|nr:hypothetical protein [archaeon]
MYSTFYNSGSNRKGNFNPYRHGVLIGNFVEDTFGQDLQQKYRSNSYMEKAKKLPLTEHQDRFRWPISKDDGQRTFKNSLTNFNASGFDFNIDFSKNKDPSKRLKLETKEELFNHDKNIIYPDELVAQQKMSKTATGFFNPETERCKNILGNLHLKDVKGVLNTR